MTQEQSAPKMIHEEVYDKYGIDLKELYKDSKHLKPVPNEWFKDIFKNCADSLSIKPESMSFNARIFNFTFTSKDNAEAFLSEFGKNIISKITEYIITQNEDPKKYDKSLIFTDELNGTNNGATLVLSY